MVAILVLHLPKILETYMYYIQVVLIYEYIKLFLKTFTAIK